MDMLSRSLVLKGTLSSVLLGLVVALVAAAVAASLIWAAISLLLIGAICASGWLPLVFGMAHNSVAPTETPADSFQMNLDLLSHAVEAACTESGAEISHSFSNDSAE